MDVAPPASLPPIKAPDHSDAFRKRRTANWLVLGLTYATMYMGRYNFGLVNKSLSVQYGFDTKQIGSIISAASLIYGLSAIFNGLTAPPLVWTVSICTSSRTAEATALATVFGIS